MSDYIINPSWFYWIRVCEGAKVLCCVIGCLCAAGFIVGAISYFMDKGINDVASQLSKKLAVRFAVAVIVTMIVGIFIPSKETLIQMKLAELGTYDNANKVIESIQDATDYILDHVSGK